MTRPPIQWTLPFIVVALALGGCRDHDRKIDRGPVVKETRDVGSFESIALRGSAELRVKIGSERSVAIEGSERSIGGLSTEVSGDTLYITTARKEWSFGKSRVVIHITTPTLAELRLEGGNDVRLQGFNGGNSRIEIEGAAHVKANGRLDKLIVHMAGAGHADLKQLVANDAKVTVEGVGSVYVNSTGTLDATMNGVGAILYSGSPHEVNTSMNGLGTISRDRDRSKDKDKDDDWDNDWNDDAPAVERDKPQAVDPETLQPEYEKKEVSIEATAVI